MYSSSEVANKFILFFVFFCVVRLSFSSDDFNFLYSKLTSFQAHACDGEQLNLTCTPNTVISVQFVQYGRYSTSNELCPGQKPYYSSCNVQDALKVIQAQCHTGKVCRLLIYPDMFPSDPCRGVQKYAEVMYKCRPEEFLNKVACEDKYLYLKCPPGQVIIILSAYFGTTKEDVIDCPQTDNTRTEDCTVSYVDQTVDRICSGKENCSLLADTLTFGDPMCKGRKHLKVKYSCVEKMVLVKQSISMSSGESIETTSFPGWFRGKDQSMKQPNHWPRNYIGRTTESSDLLKSEMQSDEVPIDYYKTGSTTEKRKIVGFMSGWVSAHKYVQGNKDKFILYTTVSLGVGFLLFITVLAGRLFMNRMRTKSDDDNVIHITPETEDQFFSDSDLDQFEPPEPLPLPVNNYTASMKRKDSDVLPRAPINTGRDLNHYFS
ncbi:protein eva-1 homolog C isoform X2 [Parasteatoda tepidariorum]|uniref:protein eva-1 homolog C isoform X2 n=1 Tax=Parasteatoda tepidariorum TaxID=114398 RepID=UPI00077FBFDE|nr:protein eva-1 homolog C isoform X2 [Parasteatoda tepidariorum]